MILITTVICNTLITPLVLWVSRTPAKKTAKQFESHRQPWPFLKFERHFRGAHWYNIVVIAHVQQRHHLSGFESHWQCLPAIFPVCLTQTFPRYHTHIQRDNKRAGAWKNWIPEAVYRYTAVSVEAASCFKRKCYQQHHHSFQLHIGRPMICFSRFLIIIFALHLTSCEVLPSDAPPPPPRYLSSFASCMHGVQHSFPLIRSSC